MENKKREIRTYIDGDVNRSTVVIGNNNIISNKVNDDGGEAYLDPQALFEDLQLHNFTGREWLLEKIDEFLNRSERGVYVIEASAGAGKTMFLAHLVKKRGYIHHFVSLAPGDAGVPLGLRSISYQLIRRWKIEPYYSEGVSFGQSSRPDFLQLILPIAAKNRDKSGSSEKIVIVIDGLDEAGIPYNNQNIMGLPQKLPNGVYLIVSQRPVRIPFTVIGKTEHYYLDIEGLQNLQDLQLFISNIEQKPQINNLLKENGITLAYLQKILLEKSRGLWIYIRFVVDEFLSGERQVSDLSKLPQGLAQYYARYWAKWRDHSGTEWHRVYLHLLTLLTAAKEPVPLSLLVKWMKLDNPSLAIQKLLEEDWRPFILVTNDSHEKRYGFYHLTLKEFFNGLLDQESLGIAEKSWIDELHEAVINANIRIAGYYLDLWGGLDSNLRAINENTKGGFEGDYGLRYLITHLLDAGQFETVHKVLFLNNPQIYTHEHPTNRWAIFKFNKRKQIKEFFHQENILYKVHQGKNDLSGYITDIDLAWKYFEDKELPLPSSELVSRQIQYALVRSSINSYMENTSPELLPVLLGSKLWNTEQAKVFVNTIRDPNQRAFALTDLSGFLPDDDKIIFLHEALQIAECYKDGKWTKLYKNMLPQLIKLNLSADVTKIYQMTDDLIDKMELYKEVGNILPEDEKALLFEIIRKLPNQIDKVQAFLFLLPSLQDEEQLFFVREIENLLDLASTQSTDEENRKEDEDKVRLAFPNIIFGADSLSIFFRNSHHRTAWVFLAILFKLFPDVRNMVRTLLLISPYLPEKGKDKIIDNFIRNKFPLLGLVNIDDLGGARDICKEISVLINLLPGKQKQSLCADLIAYSKGPCSIKWWKWFLEKRFIKEEKDGDDELYNFQYVWLDTILSVTSIFQGRENLSMLRAFRLIFLYNYYKEVPKQYKWYVSILNRELLNVSANDKSFILIELLPFLEKEERKEILNGILRILPGVPIKERKERILSIIPWIKKDETFLSELVAIESLLGLCQTIEDFPAQNWAYSGLIPFLAVEERKRQSETVMNGFHDQNNNRVNVWALKRIISHLSIVSFEKALVLAERRGMYGSLETVSLIKDDFFFPRIGLAEMLISCPDETRRSAIFDHARNSFVYSNKLPSFLIDSALFIPNSKVEEAVGLAYKESDPLTKALTLTALVVRLDPKRKDLVISNIQEIFSNFDRELKGNADDLTRDTTDWENHQKADELIKARTEAALYLSRHFLSEEALLLLLPGTVDGKKEVNLDNSEVQAISEIILSISVKSVDRVEKLCVTPKMLFNPNIIISVFIRYMDLKEYQKAYDVLTLLGSFTVEGDRSEIFYKLHPQMHPEKTIDCKPLEQLLWLYSFDCAIYAYYRNWFTSIDYSIANLCKSLPDHLVMQVFEKVEKQTDRKLRVIFLLFLINRIPNDLKGDIKGRLVNIVMEYVSKESGNSRQNSDIIKLLMENGFIKESLQIAENSKEDRNTSDNLLATIIRDLDNCTDIEEEVLATLTKAILKMDGNIYQMRGFEAIGNILIKLPEEKRYKCWLSVWSNMRSCNRQDLLWHICALAPAIFEFGGTKTIDTVYQSIKEICGCWP